MKLMLKQMITEWKLTKIKVPYVWIAIGIGTVCTRIWILVFVVSMIYFVILISVKRRKEVPEIISFIPAGEQFFMMYRRMKAGLESGIYCLLFLLAQCVCIGEQEPFKEFGNMMMCTIVMWCFLTEGIIETENAAYTKKNVQIYRKVCCPLWYRAACGLQSAALSAVVFTSFTHYYETETWHNIVLCIISTVFVIVCHIFLMQHLCRESFIGDYNGKEVKQDGEV